MNPELSAALVRVAYHFEEIARREGGTDSPLVVTHHGGDGHGRAYVRVLGDLTKFAASPRLAKAVTATSVSLDS
jgi:hypothetical protein